MMKMNWTHYSKAVALGVLLAVALAAAGTVGAVTITGFNDAPTEGEVGDEVSISVEMTELYGADVPDDDWTLSGETELDNADWSVVLRDAGGSEADRQDVSGESFEQDIDRDENHVTAEITVTGDVPELTQYDFEDKSVEEITGMDLAQVTGDGDRSGLSDGTHMVHRYTEDSQAARLAIEDAQTTAEEADSDSARDRIQDAITFYNSGEFESALNAAEDAKDSAEGAQQTRQILIFGGAAVVVLAIIAGGIYYWRQSQQSTSKLQ